MPLVKFYEDQALARAAIWHNVGYNYGIDGASKYYNPHYDNIALENAIARCLPIAIGIASSFLPLKDKLEISKKCCGQHWGYGIALWKGSSGKTGAV